MLENPKRTSDLLELYPGISARTNPKIVKR